MTTELDLQRLIDGAVMEDRHVEYKELLPKDTDEAKKEFLKDVSAFANTSGGTLYFGVRESHGVAVEIVGLDLKDTDSEKLRLENLIRDCIEPRLHSLEIEIVRLASSKFVFVLKIRRSWALPHAVRYKRLGGFYGRSSAGKFQLDVGQLRQLFSQSEMLVDRMRNFRRDRLGLIEAGESALGGSDDIVGPKVILHLIPVQAFSPGAVLDLSLLDYQAINQLPTISGTGNAFRHNLDGCLVCAVNHSEKRTLAYTQIFRNGCIEAADAFLLSAPNNQRGLSGERLIPSISFEKKIAAALGAYLKFIQRLGIQSPVYLTLSLLQVAGYYMSVRYDFNGLDGSYIDRSEVLLPEIAMEDLSEDPYIVLRPLFDMVWNAAGWPRSMNYNEDGTRRVE